MVHDPANAARFGDADVERLLADPGIVRNRLKVHAAIDNARAVLDVQADHGSLHSYLWGITGGPVTNRYRTLADLPAETETSRRLSKELKGRGFRFVGPTICYAFMQAVGMVNDHEVGCFRHAAVG